MKTALAFAALLLAAGCTTVPAPVASAAGCDLHYRITPRHDVQPRTLDVELTYAAGPRTEGFVRAAPGWAGATNYASYYGAWSAASSHHTVTQAELPNRWRVSHLANETVTVRWQVRHGIAAQDEGKPQDQVNLYRAQIGADWFQFFGHAVLASVEHWDDRSTPTTCITLRSTDASAPVFSSHGARSLNGQTTWRVKGSPQLTRHAFYAGGAGWRVQTRRLSSGPLLIATRGRFEQMRDTEFTDATAALIDTQRCFWGNEREPLQLFVLTPNHGEGNYGGTLVHQAAVLHAPNEFRVGHQSFEHLVAHENLHQWFPRRFGTQGEGGAAEVPRYWFSEGFTDYFTHRLLLASGVWSLDRYADRLTQKIRNHLRSPARAMKAVEIAPQFFSNRDAGQQLYARGEWLAMRWDQALRSRGHGGLHVALRGLLLPADGAPRDTPPATERVLDALTPLLAPSGIDPRAEVRRHVDEGQPFDFDTRGAAALLGPCLEQTIESVPVWTLGFDRASLDDGKLRGVDPQGPAYAAGLRDGMQAVGFSIQFGNVEREVLVQVRDAANGAVRDVQYRPVSGTSERLPRWRPRADATMNAVCQRWQRAT